MLREWKRKRNPSRLLSCTAAPNAVAEKGRLRAASKAQLKVVGSCALRCVAWENKDAMVQGFCGWAMADSVVGPQLALWLA